ncbi:hypothetical protein TSUD_287890 [Trifolium subterraneum]|uniref:Retrotransposon gag domain-containing protein n=1 Tax=Trifolium subterraneum TaxID=3900 RepID=A0A2Z6NL61_TRISU|nr:hypothetical protein TSUD_287890 [Trifolium subterraneum]
MQGRKKVVRELLFDPKIEKIAKANRKTVRLARQAARLAGDTRETSEEEVSSSHTSEDETESMVGVVQPPRRTLGDYGLATDDQNPNLGFQPVNLVSFDIKNTMLSALKENQFSGGESECPNIHLSRFYEACGFSDLTGVSESNKKLRLFLLSLIGRAKDWIDTLPPNTFATWDELELKFCERYFPIHKFLERRNDITNFEQGDSESLYDAWERFKLCLKKCPKHGLDNHAQMQNFTQGLRPQTRMLLDVSAGGSLKNKDESELCILNSVFILSHRLHQLRSREVPSPEVVSKKKSESSDEGARKKRDFEKEEKKESEGEVEKKLEIVNVPEDVEDELVENQREKQIERDEKLVAKKKCKDVEEKEGQKEKEHSVHAKLPYPQKKKAKEEDPQ